MSGTTSTTTSNTIVDPCQRLRDADLAYHQLSTGAAIRMVRDENGEEITFNAANRAGLLAYIQQLQPLCTTYTATALQNTVSRPMRFFF